MTFYEDFMSYKDFVIYYNQLRREHLGKWVFYRGEVDGRTIQAKSYNTWLQIYRIDGVDYAGAMEGTVKYFKQKLVEPFEVHDDN